MAHSASSDVSRVSCNQMSGSIHCTKELLATKYALAKFRVYIPGDRPFISYGPCVITHGRKYSTTSRKEWLRSYIVTRSMTSSSIISQYDFASSLKRSCAATSSCCLLKLTTRISSLFQHFY